jgi:hypothetical protein
MGDHPCRARAPSAIDRAYRLYCRRASFQRWEAEARLLAGEAFDQVAEKCDCRATTIEAYHSVFFDVQDRLGAIDYIANSVIGPRRLSGLTAADVDILLKLFSYGGGPLVLDGLVRYYRRPLAIPARWDGLDDAALAEVRSQLLVRGTILALTSPADPKGQKKLEALQDALQALAAHGATEASPAGLLEGPVRAEVELAQALAASQLGPATSVVVADVEAGADGLAREAA